MQGIEGHAKAPGFECLQRIGQIVAHLHQDAAGQDYASAYAFPAVHHGPSVMPQLVQHPSASLQQLLMTGSKVVADRKVEELDAVLGQQGRITPALLPEIQDGLDPYWG